MNLNHQDMLRRITGDELVSTYAPIKSFEVVAQQRIIYNNAAWYEPKDKTNDEAIFAVPEKKFDFLEMRVHYLYTRDDSVLDDPVWFAEEDGVWHAKFKLKKGGTDEHKVNEWSISTRSALNWYVTTLSLRDLR